VPYCKFDLQSLASINDQIHQLERELFRSCPDSARFTAPYVETNKLPFPVLSDIDLGYSLSLGLIFWVGAEITKAYTQAGVDLEKYHGNQAVFFPSPRSSSLDGTSREGTAGQCRVPRSMEPAAIIAGRLQGLRAGEPQTTFA
jgi:hypothetical protein